MRAMARHMLIRGSGADEYVVPETPLPLEANLHDALTKHPELLPSEDMGLGRIVVVGRGSSWSVASQRSPPVPPI